MAPQPPYGSLNAIAQSVRRNKTASHSQTSTSRPRPRARESAKTFKSSEFVDASSDESDDSSESDGDGVAGLQAAKEKLLMSSKKKDAPHGTRQHTRLNGVKKSTYTAPVASAVSASSPGEKKQTKKKEPAVQDSSSSESESEEEQAGDPSTKHTARTNKSSDAASGDGESSTSESESESESESAESSAEDQSGEESARESDAEAQAVSRVNGTDTVPRPQWLNDSDFTIRKATSDNPGKEVADYFSKANLEGKQLWYFTAPASLPITVLKDMEIDLNKAASGGTLLSHNGDEYGLELEPYSTNTQIQLLIPSDGGDKYKTVNRGVDSTVHVQLKAKFGEEYGLGATAIDQYSRQPKATRQQPKDLKPRFTPIGVPNSTPTKPTATAPKPSPIRRPDASSSPASASGSRSTSEFQEPLEIESQNDIAPATLSQPSASRPKKAAEAPASDTVKRKRKHSNNVVPSESPEKAAQLDEKPSKKPKKVKSEPSYDLKKTASATPLAQSSSRILPSSEAKVAPSSQPLKSSVPHKETPVPPPIFGYPTSSVSAPANAPPSETAAPKKESKEPRKAKAKEPQNDAKVSKRTKKDKSHGKSPKKPAMPTSETPIPPPNLSWFSTR